MNSLLARTRRFVWRTGYYSPGYDFEDLVLVALEGGLEAIDGGPWRENVFWTGARNSLIDVIKTNTRQKAIPYGKVTRFRDALDPGDPGGIPEAINRVALEQIIAAAELTDHEQLVVREFLLTERSSREVGERLGIDPKSIDNATHKARQKLKQAAAR